MLALLACVSAPLTLRDDVREDTGATRPETEVDTAAEPVERLPGDTAPPTANTDIEGELFGEDAVIPLSITIDDVSWRALRSDGHAYAPVTLEWEGQTQEVAIHIKGSSSWQDIDQKPSLVVDVQHLVNQRFLGQEKFYLHNDCYDPSSMSETLAYGFYRSWGYPASRTRFARLTVNGDDYGLYTIVEAHEEDFLAGWFSSPDGNLYENADAYCDVDDLRCMEVDEDDEGDDDAFRELASLTRPSGDWWAELGAQLDAERFVAYLAHEISIVHWDSYSYDLSNYSLYHDPGTGQWTMLTQSMDLDFGYRPWSYPDCGQYAMDPSDWTMGALAERCHEDADCFAALLDAVQADADALEAADGAAQVVALDALIGEEVRSDPRRYTSDADYDRHVACLQTFFAEQPDRLRAWVAAEREE